MASIRRNFFCMIPCIKISIISFLIKLLKNNIKPPVKFILDHNLLQNAENMQSIQALKLYITNANK